MDSIDVDIVSEKTLEFFHNLIQSYIALLRHGAKLAVNRDTVF